MTDKQITDKFEIKCKNCNSTDIEFEFYSGYVSDCGGERSLISHDYARNFICDFVIGKTQNIGQQKLF